MKKLLKKYENKSPEIVFEWKDSLSNAEGWVVINSLRGGACGGGTRMRKGLNIIVTPHTGGMTIEGQTKAYNWAVNKL